MSDDDRDRLRDAFQRVYGGRYWRPGLEARVMTSTAERRERHSRRATPTLVVAAALAVLAVATLIIIGRSVHPPIAPAVPAAPVPTSSPTALPTSLPTPVPSAAPPPAAQAPAQGCRSSQLTVRARGTRAAAGNAGDTFTFHNQSGVTCTLFGYPGLQMLDASGGQLPTSVNWGSDYTVRPQAPALVTLGPGEEASFALGYASPGGFNISCPSSTSLVVTPPNETQPIVIPYQMSPSEPDTTGSNGQCGRVTVSPVYPGSGPQPQ
jgi:hypothetical protein